VTADRLQNLRDNVAERYFEAAAAWERNAVGATWLLRRA
jgi:hypothetical protein